MSTEKLTTAAKEAAIQSFVEFIRFPTVSSTGPATGSYRDCANWLKDRLHFLDEVFFLEDAPDHSPVVVARWKGRDETLPVLLLNSHYDVVPAEASDWSIPPFEGLRKDRMGSPVIYGRGTQVRSMNYRISHVDCLLYHTPHIILSPIVGHEMRMHSIHRSNCSSKSRKISTSP
jgi:hypothetical protein